MLRQFFYKTLFQTLQLCYTIQIQEQQKEKIL